MKTSIPKVLQPMCGRSLLEHAIAAARGLDPSHLVVVVRHERDKVAAHALAFDPDVVVADQDDVKGTGRAVWCALRELPADLEGPVLVMAGDTPLLSADVLAGLLAEHEGSAVTVLTASVPDAAGYGRILRDEAGEIRGIVEHGDATAEQRDIGEINTSTYVFDAAFLRGAIADLDAANAQGELYLTDVVAAAAPGGRHCRGLRGLLGGGQDGRARRVGDGMACAPGGLGRGLGPSLGREESVAGRRRRAGGRGRDRNGRRG